MSSPYRVRAKERSCVSVSEGLYIHYKNYDHRQAVECRKLATDLEVWGGEKLSACWVFTLASRLGVVLPHLPCEISKAILANVWLSPLDLVNFPSLFSEL